MALSYVEKLKSPKWQKKRLKILERDNWTCMLCQDTEETLHVHHQSYSGNPWDVKDELLSTYCCVCHHIVEDFSDMLVDVVKVFKSEKSKNDTICSVILKEKFNYTFSIFFLTYDHSTNTTTPKICFSPQIVRKLNEYLDILKSKNPEYGE